MKVALVHDYLREYGGAERVLEALHDLFPDAPVYTSYYRPKGLGPHKERIKKWEIHTSFLQKIPFVNPLISPLRIIAPLLFENFDLKHYDVVISSAAVYFAKAVITRPDTLHISYIHTPPRYLYGYATPTNLYSNPLKAAIVSLMNHVLRIWDFETSQRPDVIVVNSKNVATRVQKFYRRESIVIYPPVAIEVYKNAVTAQKGEYFISLNRLYSEKNIDLIVKACSELHLPLKVVGVGPQMSALKKIATKNVEFLGEVSDEEKIALLANAKATILASKDEDFGIVPVE
jgi:glycosyltransferase involved in cell wall biosynthesis